jgi:hypothetical protein
MRREKESKQALSRKQANKKGLKKPDFQLFQREK